MQPKILIVALKLNLEFHINNFLFSRNANVVAPKLKAKKLVFTLSNQANIIGTKISN